MLPDLPINTAIRSFGIRINFFKDHDIISFNTFVGSLTAIPRLEKKSGLCY